jgi:hypothetical protein
MGLGIDRNQPNIIAVRPSLILQQEGRKTSHEIMLAQYTVRL